MQRDTSWSGEFLATLGLAGPLAAANLLQMMVYAIDVMFVARLGQEALAVSSLSVSLFALLVWSASGMVGAVTPLIAAERGRGRHALREIRRSIRMALWLAVLLAIGAIAICGEAGAILRAAGEPERIARRAGAFLAVLEWASLPMIAGSVLRSFVAAMGRPAFATLITALAIAINALGNYAFVFGHWGLPALGLRGSALSSNCTAWAVVFAYAAAISLDPRLRRYRLFGRWWRADRERFAELVRIGTPIALTIVAEGGLFGSAAFLMGLLSEVQLAAHSLALQIAAFAFQLPMGIGQAATIRVGLHYGAGDRAGIARAGWMAVAIGVGFSLAGAGLMIFAPRLLLSAYVDVTAPANAAMIGHASRFLAVAAAFQLADGAQTIAAGALRGLQDTRVPMAIALAGYWLPGFGAAVGLGFATPLAGLGVWIGLAIGLVVVASLLLRRWSRRESLGLVAPAG
ncbi:MAG: MATE family efflux transporter [Sphingomonadales bacterium]|nr:MATE family efflux transporter [Sphingomonadales bacterium]